MSAIKTNLMVDFKQAREKYHSSENAESACYFRGYMSGVLSASYLTGQIDHVELETIIKKLIKEDAEFIKYCSE